MLSARGFVSEGVLAVVSAAFVVSCGSAADDESSYNTDEKPSYKYTVTPLQTVGVSFSNLVVGRSFVVQMPAAGGTPPYAWTVSTGNLVPGLTLAADGRMSGTPSATGSYTHTLKVTDSLGASATGNYTDSPGTAGTTNFALLSFQLPTFGQERETAFVIPAQGSQDTLPWTFTCEGLPPGLTCNPTTGLVSGIPSSAFDGQTTIKLADRSGNPAAGSPAAVALHVKAPEISNPTGGIAYYGNYSCTGTTVTPAGTTSGPGTFSCTASGCADSSSTFKGSVDSKGQFTGTTVVCQGCLPLDVSGSMSTSNSFTISGHNQSGSISQTLVCRKS